MKFGLKFGGVLVALEALLLWFAPVAIGTNEPIAVLQTRTATYTNVTITGRGGTNIYVRHSGGVSSIRIDELEPCVNIVISRHKNLWWALFLILPATNVLAFLYLAMASADETRSAGQGTSFHGRAQPTT